MIFLFVDVQSYHPYYQTWCYYVVMVALKNNNILVKHSVFIHGSFVCVCVFFFSTYSSSSWAHWVVFCVSFYHCVFIFFSSLFFVSYVLFVSFYWSVSNSDLVLMPVTLCNMIFCDEANYSAFLYSSLLKEWILF